MERYTLSQEAQQSVHLTFAPCVESLALQRFSCFMRALPAGSKASRGVLSEVGSPPTVIVPTSSTVDASVLWVPAPVRVALGQLTGEGPRFAHLASNGRIPETETHFVESIACKSLADCLH